MSVYFVEGEAEGAFPNGTRVVKCETEDDDRHQVGDEGVVVASHGPLVADGYPPAICYFVEWDDMPGLPVFVVGWKISAAR